MKRVKRGLWIILSLLLALLIPAAAQGLGETQARVAENTPVPEAPSGPPPLPQDPLAGAYAADGGAGSPAGSGPPWQQSPDGHHLLLASAQTMGQASNAALQGAGGPDLFGYWWDDTVTYNWIDATNGTDTGLGGSTEVVGPISLPFSFKFYENTYNRIYVSKYGYLGFTNVNLTRERSRIPFPNTPNNVIAPYWAPFLLRESGYAGEVSYISGGTAPNRYFVVEWYQVRDPDQPAAVVFTFEVVLHENGDIRFQYNMMTYGNDWYCGQAGIEDREGFDGLAYGSFCQEYTSNKAVHFYRPEPAARLKITPLYQGRFVRAGETAAFQVAIRNTGEMGSDVYNLFAMAAEGWGMSLSAAAGLPPLADSDGDYAPDTGPLPQGGTFTVTVMVTAPAGGTLGDARDNPLIVCSSLNPDECKTVTLQTAIPVPFAQVLRDDADGAMSLYLVQPGAQALKKTTPDKHNGYELAVAEMSNGFAYFWARSRLVGSLTIREIEYTLLDRYGNPKRGVSRLADHSGATMHTYDYAPAIAVAPDGRIGVLWYRYLWNSSTSQFNYNVFFAVLSSSGDLAFGPVNLTSNNAWG
ncbi:MAG TPA: hypothetical protein VMY80_12410, partial [Anaerolineae bacterium]|nr:hypothetical protein [Anaerolineae bacterium]